MSRSRLLRRWTPWPPWGGQHREKPTAVAGPSITHRDLPISSGNEQACLGRWRRLSPAGTHSHPAFSKLYPLVGGVSLARESLPGRRQPQPSLVLSAASTQYWYKTKFILASLQWALWASRRVARRVASRSATPATALTSDLALHCQSSPIPAKVNLVNPWPRALSLITRRPLG